MPSGSKKRKAAKKKKQKEANNNNSAAHSHGDDDQNVHDEKESDGGEDSSPASQEHHNHRHSFTQGEEEEMEKREDNSTVQSIVSESEPVVRITGNGDSTYKMSMKENSVIQVDRELKPEEDSDSKNVSSEHVESVKESHGGRVSLDGGSSSTSTSSSSSSSSSDDDSHVVENKVVVMESGESKVDASNLVSGSVAIADFPEVTDGVPAMEAYDLVVGEPKEEAYDPVAANAPSVNLVKPADLSDVPIFEACRLVVGTVPLVDSENVSEEVVPVNDSSLVENPMCSNVFPLGSKENGKNESSGVSLVVMDMGPQPEEDKVASTAGENSAVSSGAMGIATQEDEDKLLPSSSVPTVGTSNGAEHIKDSVISECSDSQPLVASAQRPVQTASWMSCCGLFEVFTGSNR